MLLLILLLLPPGAAVEAEAEVGAALRCVQVFRVPRGEGRAGGG
jgi:hypothetical protein